MARDDLGFIVFDLDGTLCPIKQNGENYIDLPVDKDVLSKLREYKDAGFKIAIYTARNMRTHGGNIGRINADTAKTVIAWLDKHDVPYDEIYYGKPWPGAKGFYVDDRTIRPSELLELSVNEIEVLLENEKNRTYS